MPGLVATDATSIRALLGDKISESTKHDPELDRIAALVSSALEGPELLGRKLRKEAHEEVRSIPEGRTRRLITLYQAPIDLNETFEVRIDSCADWANADPIDADRYVVTSPESGRLRLITKLRGPTFLRFNYTAGFAVDLADLLTNYPEIAQTATLWAGQIWMRRARIDRKSEARSGPGGTTVTFSDEVGKVPAVAKTAIRRYMRVA